ncbi:MAG TPA: Xaa-Pro peptidase family protein [Gemmatimonadales bacterium]|nr:Xaa-Pro peptidase family protein [Gemmatimonadales bacterium]
MTTPPLTGFEFPALRDALASLGADGWLLYDFHGNNPAASRVLGIHGMGTRRYFVLLPREGPPVALAHRIERTAFDGFPGAVREYAAWRELHDELRALVAGKTLAMEISPRDAVPYLDRVPHGVIELIESFGARVVSSGPLISRFAARWSAEELAGHRRAAEAIAQIARETLAWAGAEFARGAEVRETLVQSRVMDAFGRAGLVTDHPPIVGFQANAANPHYEPRPGEDRRLAAGDVLLLDLWAGVARGTVFADQTWMAFVGREPSAEVRKVWDAVRGARDAAVALLAERWKKKEAVTGAALDDAARGVIRAAGFGEYFVHRTGHSIDRDLHGSGPHLDNFETADERMLIAGVGFSVEPGVYLPGRFGMRSEINVFVAEAGPEVTPARPQHDLLFV